MKLARLEAHRARAIAPRAAQAEHCYAIGRQLDHNAPPPDAHDFGSVSVSKWRRFSVHPWCPWCWLLFFLRHAPVIITLSMLLPIAAAWGLV